MMKTIQIEYDPDNYTKIYCHAIELIGDNIVLDHGTTVLEAIKVISISGWYDEN